MITSPVCFVFAQKEECCEIIISWDGLAISLAECFPESADL
jgi:hypothetical protein